MLQAAAKKQQSLTIPSGIFLEKEIQLWEQHVNTHGNFKQINEYNQKYFSDLLSTENDADSYLTSPTYYAFTGRHGLWIYQEGQSFIPFCWHPNVAGQILIFPQRGTPNSSLLQNFLHKIPEPPKGLRIARVKNGTDLQLPEIEQSVIFAPVIENVLDWKFPVRVLSTERVMNISGPGFKRVRNHVNRIKSKNVWAKSLHEVSRPLLNDFIHAWAIDNASSVSDAEELVALYQKILAMSDKHALNLNGFVVLIDERIEALNIWDISNVDIRIANRFVNLCNTSFRGLADYSLQQAAERLHRQGIQYLNVGGAETASLDQFKSKFMPAYSIEMHSIDIVYEDFDVADGLSRHIRLEKPNVQAKRSVGY